MEPQKFCQSCTLPLDKPENRGTEKDGSKSDMYCKYCYQNGAFTKPEMTLAQMTELAKTEMKKQKLSESLIKLTIDMLPGLKRWKTSKISQ